MKSETVIETTIKIELTIEEANILSQLVQNSQVPPEDEPVETSRLREALFNACKPLGIR